MIRHSLAPGGGSGIPRRYRRAASESQQKRTAGNGPESQSKKVDNLSEKVLTLSTFLDIITIEIKSTTPHRPRPERNADMTTKEIAADTMHEIVTTCDTARPAVHWIDQAEVKILDAFTTARSHRLSVLTTARALSKAAHSMGIACGNGVDIAIDNALTEWDAWGRLSKADARKYSDWCVSLMLAE